MSDEIVRGSESDRTTDPRESRVPRPPSPTACVPCAVGGGARGGRWRAVRVLSFVCSIHVRSRARPRARWKENLTTRSAKAFSLRSAKALSKSQNTTSPRTRDADEAQTQSESASTAVRGRTWGARQPRARPSCTATRPALSGAPQEGAQSCAGLALRSLENNVRTPSSPCSNLMLRRAPGGSSPSQASAHSTCRCHNVPVVSSHTEQRGECA